MNTQLPVPSSIAYYPIGIDFISQFEKVFVSWVDLSDTDLEISLALKAESSSIYAQIPGSGYVCNEATGTYVFLINKNYLNKNGIYVMVNPNSVTTGTLKIST